MGTVSPNDYFRAGRELLAHGGIKAVTIANLCERLQVTKGSFYYHFRNGEDFLDRLLDDWLAEHVARRTAVADAHTDPMERLQVLKRFAVEREHETEAAIRAWARADQRAAEVQRQIDQTRITYAVQTYVDLGVPPDRALTFAQLSVVVLAGTQNLMGTVDVDMLARITDELYDVVLDAIPAKRRRKLAVASPSA
jgi:AcrR family transcriptional regulator